MEAPSYKQGITLRVLLDRFTDEEWGMIQGWDSISASARRVNRLYPSIVKEEEGLPLLIETSTEDRSILLYSRTDNWPIGLYSVAVEIFVNGEMIPIPATGDAIIEIEKP